MGFFYSVRGWLELDDESSKLVQVIISRNEDQSPYTDSWHFPQKGGGFSRFVFFGCTVRDSSLNEIKQQIQRIATTVFSRDGEFIDYAEGVFHVAPEDDSCEMIWTCKDGSFTEQMIEVKYGSIASRWVSVGLQESKT
jgi:hypothetical protein